MRGAGWSENCLPPKPESFGAGAPGGPQAAGPRAFAINMNFVNFQKVGLGLDASLCVFRPDIRRGVCDHICLERRGR